MSFKIKDIWAFISIDKDGEEGICAIKLGDTWMPMIMADEKRIRSLRPAAEKMAKETNKCIKFVKFSNRIDLENLNG